MSKVIVDVSPSLDGYLAGEEVSVERPFGTAGHRLHRWLGFEGATPAEADHEAAAAMFVTAGAVVLGRRMFEVGIGTWGADGAFGRPCFVATHRPHENVDRGPTSFEFVTDGVPETVAKARAAAGGKDVIVVGGASVVQQCLAAGLVDEMRLHVVPVLLGAGTPLFADSSAAPVELEQTGVVATAEAVHVTYRVTR
ncbi:dihydrofolate reductase family protein [Nocardioides speluncae]|uniref:dihydrofolate reductase family protein n=1 Tax=Nocardioides speluncae TaxID=2670337 RepID=UPI000D68D90E|nr:dihydrofolate reductase family protein [Nocardioides speluncae]